MAHTAISYCDPTCRPVLAFFVGRFHQCPRLSDAVPPRIASRRRVTPTHRFWQPRLAFPDLLPRRRQSSCAHAASFLYSPGEFASVALPYPNETISGGGSCGRLSGDRYLHMALAIRVSGLRHLHACLHHRYFLYTSRPTAVIGIWILRVVANCPQDMAPDYGRHRSFDSDWVDHAIVDQSAVDAEQFGLIRQIFRLVFVSAIRIAVILFKSPSINRAKAEPRGVAFSGDFLSLSFS